MLRISVLLYKSIHSRTEILKIIALLLAEMMSLYDHFCFYRPLIIGMYNFGSLLNWLLIANYGQRY